MTTANIRLTTLEDVRNFVNIVTKYDLEVDVCSGRYVVDAKSILGIFSLDLLSPISLTVHEGDSTALMAELQPYIVD